jgi:hypothetical protein
MMGTLRLVSPSDVRLVKRVGTQTFHQRVSARVGSGQEILAIATYPVRPSAIRIAIGDRGGGVSVYDYNYASSMDKIFNLHLNEEIPRGLHFRTNDITQLYVADASGGCL